MEEGRFSLVASGPFSRVLNHLGLTGPDQLPHSRAALILTERDAADRLGLPGSAEPSSKADLNASGLPLLAVVIHQIPLGEIIG